MKLYLRNICLLHKLLKASDLFIEHHQLHFKDFISTVEMNLVKHISILKLLSLSTLFLWKYRGMYRSK